MAIVKLSSGGLRPDGLRPAKTIVVVRDGIALRVNAALSESRVREIVHALVEQAVRQGWVVDDDKVRS